MSDVSRGRTPEEELSSKVGGRPGRPPKGGSPRKKANIMLPRSIHDQLTAEAAEVAVPFSDVGAYYMVVGWNATHAPEIAIPDYLQEQLGATVAAVEPVEPSGSRELAGPQSCHPSRPPVRQAKTALAGEDPNDAWGPREGTLLAS